MKEGLLAMAPYSKAVPENVRTTADKIIADTKAESYEVFTGPIADQTGKERVVKGQKMEDKDLLVMDWYVKGVQS
jgi:basic membrane protein A